jgi:hypothetical protein
MENFNISFIEKIEKREPSLKKSIIITPIWTTDLRKISSMIYASSKVRLQFLSSVDSNLINVEWIYLFAFKEARCSEIMDAVAAIKRGRWEKIRPEQQESNKPPADYRLLDSDDSEMTTYHSGVIKETNEAALPLLEYFDGLPSEERKRILSQDSNGKKIPLRFSEMSPSLQESIRKLGQVADTVADGKAEDGWATMKKASVRITDETNPTNFFNEYNIDITTDFGVSLSFPVNNYAEKQKKVNLISLNNESFFDTKVKNKDDYRKSLKKDFLKKIVDVDIKNLLFPDVLKYLYEKYDLRIVTLKTLFPQEQRVRFSLQKKDISLDKLLDVICEAFGKKEYKIKNMPYAMEWELRSSNIIVMRPASSSYRMLEWQAEQDRLKALKKK